MRDAFFKCGSFAAALACFALAHLAALSAQAEGVRVPSYDVEKLCTAMAEGTGDPERAKFLCLALEKQQRLRLVHQDVTSGAFRSCAERERLGSYFSLNTCLNEAAKKQGEENRRQRVRHGKERGRSIPRYDIGSYCMRAVRAFQGSPALELDCRAREQDALKQILGMDAGESALRVCAETTESVKGGYVLLRDCLLNEQASAPR